MIVGFADPCGQALTHAAEGRDASAGLWKFAALAKAATQRGIVLGDAAPYFADQWLVATMLFGAAAGRP